MVIARGIAEGVEKIIIGLSRPEFTKVLAGRPFIIAEGLNAPPGSMPPNLEIMILCGENEQYLHAALKEAGMIEDPQT